jgi:hypothetical protein
LRKQAAAGSVWAVMGTPVSRTERIEEDRSVVGGEELVVWEGGLVVVGADEEEVEVVA